MREEIIGEDWRDSVEEVPNGGITGWFGALFESPVSVRVALDGLAQFSSAGVGSSGRGSVVRSELCTPRSGGTGSVAAEAVSLWPLRPIHILLRLIT